MKAFEITAQVDQNRLLQIEVPESISPGKVRLIVLVPEEDDAGEAWMNGISREWRTELSNADEDIYTLEDGDPIK